MVKLMIVEDQALVREALASLLSLEPDIDVIAQAKNGEHAIALLKHHRVDIILTDIEMPKMSGLDLIQHIHNHHPNIKTMIMTTFSKSGYIKRAIDNGVQALVLKEAATDDLIRAIKKVKNGNRVIEPELALLALEDRDPLSNKERQAIKLAGDGLKTAEIAAKLFLSEGTVRNYLSEAIAKLNASNRIDAARIAKQHGWI